MLINYVWVSTVQYSQLINHNIYFNLLAYKVPLKMQHFNLYSTTYLPDVNNKLQLL